MITKQQVEEVIKTKFSGECNLQDITDLDILFSDLEQDGIIDFGIYGRSSFGDGSDNWLEAHYLSKKLGLTIIADYDFPHNFDSVDELVDSLNSMQAEISKIEDSIIIKNQ